MMSVSEDMPGYGAENGSGSNAAVSGTRRFDEVFGRTDTTGRVENVSINTESDLPEPATSAPSSESISASAGQAASPASVFRRKLLSLYFTSPGAVPACWYNPSGD